MKKVLILAYDFPPFVSIGGMRPHYWYEHMKEFGVYPIVVTRQWENKFKNKLDYISPSESDRVKIEETEFGTIIRTPYFPSLANKLLLKYGEHKFKLVRKALAAVAEVMQWYTISGTKKELYYAADDYLKNNKVDAILATADPFLLFRYAHLLSEKHHIPWIADYRDMWSQDPQILKNKWYIQWNKSLEQKTLASASAVVTATETWKTVLLEIINPQSFTVIANGYDGELVNKTKKVPMASDKLSIGFMGSIYDRHPIKSVLRVFNEFAATVPKGTFEVNFYGLNIRQQIEEYIEFDFKNLKDILNIYPKMSNQSLLEKMQQNNVLLLFNDYFNTGTKIYDCLALRRRIILCYSDDHEANELKVKYNTIPTKQKLVENRQELILMDTNSGKAIKNSEALKIELGNLHREIMDKGVIDCDSRNVENYSRIIQVQKLAEIIKAI